MTSKVTSNWVMTSEAVKQFIHGIVFAGNKYCRTVELGGGRGIGIQSM